MKINVFNKWEDVKVYQYLELIESFNNDSIIDKYIQFLCILSDTEIEYWYEKDIDFIYNFVTSLEFLEKEPSNKLIKEFKQFKLIDINKIKLGEFIDIENFITENPIKNLHKLASILYRNYKIDEFNNVILEDYNLININERSEIFLNEPIINIIGIIKYINDFKNIFNSNYKPILEPNLNEEDLDSIEELTIEDKREIEKENLKKAWSWEFLLYDLSKGDITKYNEILELPLIFVFNQITFKKLFNIE